MPESDRAMESSTAKTATAWNSIDKAPDKGRKVAKRADRIFNRLFHRKRKTAKAATSDYPSAGPQQRRVRSYIPVYWKANVAR
jgi:hypothetical protein